MVDCCLSRWLHLVSLPHAISLLLPCYTHSAWGCTEVLSVFQTNLAVSVTSKLFYLLFSLEITLFHSFTYLMTPHILQILASLLLFLKSLALFPILPPHLIIEKDSFSMEQPVLMSVLALVTLYCKCFFSYLSDQFINLRNWLSFFSLEVSVHDTDNQQFLQKWQIN